MRRSPVNQPDTTHACPGDCGTRVARHLLACRPCWFRLPADLRNAVTGSFYHRLKDPAPHRQALTAAAQWYRGHPPRPAAPPDNAQDAPEAAGA